MNNVIDIYEQNILAINNAISIYRYLEAQAKCLDASILLRSQYVLVISAFDTYVHSMVIDVIMKKFFTSDQTLEIQIDIPLSLVFEIKNATEEAQKEKLYTFLVKKLSRDSFQSPKSIEYAFSIINISKVWTQLSDKIGMKAEDVKKKLSIIINRRNKIAHESDWNKVTGDFEDIELEDVLQCQEFIGRIVHAMNDIVASGKTLTTENQ